MSAVINEINSYNFLRYIVMVIVVKKRSYVVNASGIVAARSGLFMIFRRIRTFVTIEELLYKVKMEIAK